MEDITSTTQEALAPNPVRVAREALRPTLSREGLAFKAGVSAKTIERLERGEGVPRRATQRVIADVLGVSPEVLFPESEAAA